MPSLFNALRSRLESGAMILADGAWGTQLQRAGLQPGDCPEEWNTARPADVRRVAEEYFAAGADFVLTNTFGANRYRLTRHGAAERLAELNRAGFALSNEAAEKAGRVAIASVGPTGEFLEPEGLAASRELRDAFSEQIQALKSAGCEAVVIETMFVAEEAALAVQIAKEAGLYCLATMTFDATPKGFRTMMGASVEDAVRVLEAAGADVIGTNCGNGMEKMVEIARLMRPLTRKPLMVKSNAGLPEQVEEKLIYRETPEQMASHVAALRDAGVSIVGGCCGTSPDHIRALRSAVDALSK